MSKFIFSILSSASGALMSVLIAWGFIFLFFPSINIDVAFNALVVFFLLGGVSGLALYLRLSKKSKKV